ncbi:MAG TPA: DUF3592 domain-containing protein [Polyangiaceae bacterium]
MLTALFVLALSLAFVWVGVTYVSSAWRMRDYVSAPGHVIERDVHVLGSAGTREGAIGDGGGYTPWVKYRYVVNGKTYEADRIAYVRRGSKEAVAKTLLAEIPDDVVVWYDPAKPEEALLEKNSATFGFVLVALGSVLALGAIAWFFAQ